MAARGDIGPTARGERWPVEYCPPPTILPEVPKSPSVPKLSPLTILPEVPKSPSVPKLGSAGGGGDAVVADVELNALVSSTAA